MAKKLKQPEEFLTEQDITVDDAGCGRFAGRNTRLLEMGVFEIGESDRTFDRWANSVELEFDLSQAKGQRQFKRWLEKGEQL